MQRKLRESAASARSFIPRLVCFSEDRQRREVEMVEAASEYCSISHRNRGAVYRRRLAHTRVKGSRSAIGSGLCDSRE